MKKIFFITFLLVGIKPLHSQSVVLKPEVEAFLLQEFPKHMPAYVLANVDTVAVTEADTKKRVRMINLTQGVAFEDNLRVGDTVLVFEGKKFFSLKRNLFITSVEKQKHKKQKHHASAQGQSPRVRKSLDPRVVQVGTQVGQQVLSGVLWRIQTAPRRF